MAREICVGFLLVAIILSFGRVPAHAEPELVYWPLVTNGTEYRRVSYPQKAGSLHILANTEVVIEARYAPVSYWPITREYLADLSQEPRFADGTIEIVDRAGRVIELQSNPYVLWYPAGVGAGASTLIHGNPALELHQEYVKAARAAAKAEQEYQRIVADSQAAVAAWLRIAAERKENLPPPPPEITVDPPEPFQGFATEPRNAAIVSLPEGIYQLRIRNADGRIVPGSERELISFGALEHAVGYVLRPANRWTRPIVSFGPGESVYTTGETDLYVQPIRVVEYEDRRFSRLFEPQSVKPTDPTLTIWVPNEEGAIIDDGAALVLWDGGSLARTIRLMPYRVIQRTGAARGYTIEAFEPQPGSSLKPDFQAMRVEADSPATRMGLRIGNSAEPEHNSTRRIRRAAPPMEAFLFIPALLPLASSIALRLWARMRLSSARRTRKPA